MKVRIGTRGSDLALWQAHFVRDRLQSEPGVEVELVVLETRGDAIQDRPLQEVGGQGFFTVEIERALLDRRVDVAVHSHKDLETRTPPELVIAAVPERGPRAERLLVAPDAHDPAAPLLPLREGARVGTSSPRRAEQLLALRPDLSIADLRGNVPTRVRKLGEGNYDAILLAAAGLERLALDVAPLVALDLDLARLVPAPAQGALALQARAADVELLELCRRVLHDEETAAAVAAERALLAAAGGGCHMPLGASLQRVGDRWHALAFLGRGFPTLDARARWARAEGATPDEAAGAAFEALQRPPTGCGPLAGRRIALAGTGGGGSELAASLASLGAEVLVESVLALEDLEVDLDGALARLRPGDAVALTSRHAAARLAGCSVPDGVLVGAVGASTARAAREAVGRVDVQGDAGGAALAAALPLERGARCLFPCAADALPDLPAALEARGIEVERLILYRTRARADASLQADVDARVYRSPSAARAAVALERTTERVAPAERVAIGAATHAALIEEGLAAPEPPSGSGPKAALLDLLRRFAAHPSS